MIPVRKLTYYAHAWLAGVAFVLALAIPASAGAASRFTPPVPPAQPTQTVEPTTTAPTCGGETPAAPVGGGTWTCTFDDEFDSSTGDANALNTAWWTPQVTATSAYTTGPAGSEACYVDSPNNVSVSGGALHLTALKLSSPMNCGGLFKTDYTSGMVSSVSGFSQTYGRFEVSAELPATTVSGLQETLWLWPENDTAYGSSWPDSGEVDFSEFYSEYPTLDVPNIHYNVNPYTVNATTHANDYTTYCPITQGQYNAYAVTWEPGSFTVSINGNVCLIDNYSAEGLSGGAPFNQPFFIALTQALGIGSDAFNPATTPLPATTSIQYVRVWK
jgi:beta-glucanase (GH16 family)